MGKMFTMSLALADELFTDKRGMSDEALKSLRKQIESLNAAVAKMSGDNPVPTFGEFASSYLKEKLARPLREATKRSFENQVRLHLIPGFGGLFIDKMTNPVWLEWVEREKTKEGRKLTRFFNARKSLIEILRAAQHAGYIEKLVKLDDPDESKNTGRMLERQEIIQILWAAKRPFRLIFYAFFRMGCRPREILRWEWSMLSLRNDKLWLSIPARISKTGRSRDIPINPNLARIIKIRQKRGNGSIFIFPSRDSPERPQLTYQSAWSTACASAKVEAVPYDLRRTFISRCAAEGKPMIYVAKALDTSTKMIESVYAKSQAEVMEKIIED